MAKTAEPTTAELTEREALVQAVQQELGLPTKTAAVNVVKTVLGALAANLLSNGKTAGYSLRLHELATFTVKAVPARKRKNPRTGEIFEVPAGTTIKVKLAKAIREVGKGVTKGAKK